MDGVGWSVCVCVEGDGTGRGTMTSVIETVGGIDVHTPISQEPEVGYQIPFPTTLDEPF